MINVYDWDKKRARYEDYWNLQNKTPILYVTAPEDNIIKRDIGVSKDRWLDFEYHCKSSRNHFESTYFGADAYPYFLPDLGYDLVTSMMGIDTVFNEVSSWIFHKDEPLSAITEFSINDNNEPYKKMIKAITFYSEDAKKLDYIVGMIPFNTLYDGLSAIVGPEKLCLEMIDNPDEVHRVAREHFKLYKELYTISENIITKYQHGSTNWLGVYSDVPWYYISNDFIVMLSEDFFEEFILETLLETVKFHKRTLFHLDGENVTRHIDALLGIDDLTGIQVQATPFKQSAEFWTPHLKKIQSAGKATWIEARHFDDLKYLVKNLQPEGLFIKTWANTKTEAIEMEKFINNYYGELQK